jgi:proline iminopeptidase
MLVLHGGLGFDHTYLRPGLDLLSNSVELIYYDHRGNGRSAEPERWQEVTHATWADDADVLRKELGHERVILFGHSYGGFLALEYALRHPDRVAGLVLCATLPNLAQWAAAVARAQARARPAIFDALLEVFSAPAREDNAFADQCRTVLPLYFHREPAPAVLALFGAMRYRAGAFQHAALHCLPHYDVLPRLREIHAPVLLLAGRHDWLAPEEESNRIAAEAPNAQVVVFEESGHYPFLEEPERFVTAIDEWLARLPDPAPPCARPGPQAAAWQRCSSNAER